MTNAELPSGVGESETIPSGEALEPSTRLVLAVANRTGEPIDELPVLYEAVDPESLDRLIAGEQASSLEVRFEYAGFEVCVAGDGTIDLVRTES